MKSGDYDGDKVIAMRLQVNDGLFSLKIHPTICCLEQSYCRLFLYGYSNQA